MKHAKLILWSITAALAGFLFGFDTIVISGAEETFQELWQLSGFWHGLAMSMALWGTVVGALFGGWPTEKFGRRKTLIAIGILYFVSALGSGMAPEVFSFMIARFIGGLGVGASTVAAPMFISEISPPESRGKLAGMFQFNVVFGILVAYISNYFIGEYFASDVAWRWMIGIEALPALIYTLLSFTLPESPRWLITHARNSEAGRKVFHDILPEASDKEINDLVEEIEGTIVSKQVAAHFWTKRLRIPIMLAFLVAFFNQFSGINIILYFAPRILRMAGMRNALLSSAALGVTMVIFTMIGLWLIDRLGRKFLLYVGSLGYILSLAVCAFAFLTTPAFRVAAAAIDLQEHGKEYASMETRGGIYSESDRSIIERRYEAAKANLESASKKGSYRGERPRFGPDADVHEVVGKAEKIYSEASDLLGSMSLVVLISLIVFIAAHGLGQGTVIWVLIAEVFPNDHRAAGQALGSSTHWICAAVLTFVFPIIMTYFDPGALFAFFCFMMVLQLLWVKFMVPETKNISLEEMQEKLGM